MSDLKNTKADKIRNEILRYLKTHTLRETKKKFSLVIGCLPTYTMSKYSAVYKESLDSKKEDFLFYLNKNNYSDIVTTWEEATKYEK